MMQSSSDFYKILPIKRPIVLGAFLTLLLLIMVYIGFESVPNSTAKFIDRSYGFYIQLIVALITLIGFSFNLKELWQGFKDNKPQNSSWFALTIILLFVGIFTSQEVQLQHRVLSDESSWESMGIQMHYNQRAGVCNQGVFKDGILNCFEEVNNFKGKTTALLYWVMFKFADPNRDTALQLNLPLFLLSIVFIFYGSFLIFQNPWISLSAATFLGTMPKMIFQSRTATTEIAYVFFFTLLLCVIPLLRKNGSKWSHLLFVIPLLGLLAGTRQETLFSFTPIVLYYYPLWKKHAWGLPLITSALIFICAPIIITIAAYKGFNFQGGEYEAHSFYNLYRNFWDNIQVMLNLKPGPRGLLYYPFSTTQTIIVYSGTIFLLIQMIWTKRYWKQFILVAFFMLQPLVVMLNVSGNFTIDINQRYVLIILPIFSLIAGVFVQNLVELLIIKSKFKKVYSLASSFSFFLLCIICIGLTTYHRPSFNENIHYKKNKLLEEEKFLNSYLKSLPKGSIFIYARPWQMISQHLNGFSESRFLNWNIDEFQKWQTKTGDNIYLVRGQDGYGKVNKKSRVVGFKTTKKVEQILSNYKTEEIIRKTRPFGYALTVNKIVSKSSGSKFTNNTTVSLNSQTIHSPEIIVDLKKSFLEPIEYKLLNDQNEILHQQVITSNQVEIKISLTSQKGIHRYKHQLNYPDKVQEERKFSIYQADLSTILLTSLKPSQLVSGWGNSQINKTVEQNSLKVKSEVFPWGIGTHTDSKSSFALNGQYSYLNTSFGMDDESMCGDGAIFKIYGDSKLLYESSAVYAEEIHTKRINVQNIHNLELQTLQGETDLCDHTNWLNPWLEK